MRCTFRTIGLFSIACVVIFFSTAALHDVYRSDERTQDNNRHGNSRFVRGGILENKQDETWNKNGTTYLPPYERLSPYAGWSMVSSVPDVKYFQESTEVVHADFRYYNGTVYRDTNLRKERTRLLFRSWAKFADNSSFPYWIAHGSLIGMYFNNILLPWDDDIDIQMTVRDLTSLVRFNQTIIDGQFIIDLNPNLRFRVYQENNVIDGRIIDMLSGVFIDVTGISAVYDQRWGGTVYACKSPHKYIFGDLFPLHRSIFEGVATWRPNEVEHLLVEEYGGRVFSTKIFGHEWNGTVWNAVDKPPPPWPFNYFIKS